MAPPLHVPSPATRSRVTRLYGYGLAGLLGLFILGGMSGVLLAPFARDFTVPAGENRRLGDLPPLPRSLAEWNDFPQRFETFVNDRFGFRAALIRTQTDISTNLHDRLPTDQVVAGREGWLFFAGEGSLGLFQRSVELSPEQLEAWRTGLAERTRILGAHGSGYTFTIAPDKHTIYGEFMPAYLRQGNKPSSHDQVVAMTQAHGLPVVDLRPDLLATKLSAAGPAGPLYMRDDTHWNNRGAYTAYRTLMTHLGRDPIALDEADFIARPTGPGDLARMALIDRLEDVPFVDLRALPCVAQEVERQTAPTGRRLLLRTRCEGATGKLVFYHDSFGDHLLPFLAASFGETVAIWAMPTTDDIVRTVETEKPDFVLEERVERHLRFPSK